MNIVMMLLVIGLILFVLVKLYFIELLLNDIQDQIKAMITININTNRKLIKLKDRK